MNEYASKQEFDHLRTRVDVLEREVDGEKTVSRYILEQKRTNGDDLAAVRTRLDRVEGKVDRVNHTLNDLIKNLPKMIGEAVRDVFRERDQRN
jgi:tetrahydromethanopterin S-methyltransferase subunit G